jgi:hypothetical protein
VQPFIKAQKGETEMPRAKTATPDEQVENPTDETVNTPAADSTAESNEKNGTVNFDKEFTVINPNNKNLKICGMNGDIIEFDEKGEAKVKLADAEHLSKISGYTVKEK